MAAAAQARGRSWQVLLAAAACCCPALSDKEPLSAQEAVEGFQKFECYADFDAWETAWSPDQKDWCCRHFGRGCPEGSEDGAEDGAAPGPSLPGISLGGGHAKGIVPAPAPPTTTTSPPFDCEAGFAFWWKGWSEGKKEWCCKHEKKGCPTTTTSTLTGLAYHCKGDPTKWPASIAKWCCINTGLGCGAQHAPTTTAKNLLPGFNMGGGVSKPDGKYDCSKGYSYWEKLWSVEQKSYCCETENKGCPENDRPFDCIVGLEQFEKNWTAAKKVWCCAKKGLGCPSQESTSEAPYDCADTGRRWTVQRQNWCCINEGRGCATTTFTDTETRTTTTSSTRTTSTSTTTTSTTTTSTTTKTTSTSTTTTTSTRTTSTSTVTTTVDLEHSEPFDCNAGFNNWEMGWSRSKMDWCCEHYHRACLPTTTSPQPFNCAAGYDNWEAGWSIGKKTWCCEHEKKGCQTFVIPFNCSEDADKPEEWPHKKRDWCCAEGLGGCLQLGGGQKHPTSTTALKYDCDEDYDKRAKAWSKNKQEWCCKNENKGCKRMRRRTTTLTTTTTTISTTSKHFDCMAGYLYSNWNDTWSDQKKVWCCKHEKRGCHVTLPEMTSTTATSTTQQPGPAHYNCKADYKNWRQAWSVGKRVWCCLHKNVGCLKSTSSPKQGKTMPPPDQVELDCKAERSNQEMAWSLNKKKCCEPESGGCGPLVETTRLLEARRVHGHSHGRVGGEAAVMAALGSCCCLTVASLLLGALRRHRQERRSAILSSPLVDDEGDVHAEQRLMTDAREAGSPVQEGR